MASSKDAKLLKQTKFPPEFNQKVDMKKVNVEVMKKWIAGKMSEILGNEDDVVIELCFNLLEESRFPDIKDLQIKLTGFLDKDTPKFCKELWNLCLSAQSNPQGVPKELLEAKKLELIQEKIESEKAAEVARQRKETENKRERNVENIRQRERGERGRGRGGRGGFDRRPPIRDSRSPPPRDYDRRYSRSPRRRNSPPPRDYYRGPPPRRDRDVYVPRGRSDHYDDRRRRDAPRRRSPSPSESSRSRSSRPRRQEPTSPRSPPRMRETDGLRKPHSSARGDHRPRSPVPSSPSRSRSPRRSRHKSQSRSISPAPASQRHHHRGSPSYRGAPRRRYSSGNSSLSLGRNDRRRGNGHARGRSGSLPYSSSADDDGGRRDPRPASGKERSPRRKRHRSLERYAPAAARRRRNTSSVSSASRRGKRQRRGDKDAMVVDGENKDAAIKDREKDAEPRSRLSKLPTMPETTEAAPPPPSETDPKPNSLTEKRKLTETEMREKLLKERVIAMRRGSMNAGERTKTTKS